MTAVNSSQIKAIGHDPETQTLKVQFHSGAEHHYEGVTAEDHAALMAAGSIGSHFHKHFRHRANRKV